LPPETRKLYLAPSQTLDFNSKEFQKWLESHSLRRQQGEHDVDFARRVFLQTSKAFTYEWPVRHAGTASSTCKAHRGDCGGMSVVFVSALRGNGIPARALAGHYAESSIRGKKPGDALNLQIHVKAEFFAEGIGWVPVDQTYALNAKSPLRFFGHDAGDFFVQHVDFDLILDTIHFGKQRVGCMQGIPYWSPGSGSLDPKTNENWQVRTLSSGWNRSQPQPALGAKDVPDAAPSRGRPRNVRQQAVPTDLDEVLKSPEKYDGQNLEFENVAITGTVQAPREGVLWLEVKTGSGQTVPAAMRGQKVTFVIAKADAPDSIAQMAPGAAIPATLICHMRGGGQGKHWIARVRSIEVQPGK
jgi:hypothetical protein